MGSSFPKKYITKILCVRKDTDTRGLSLNYIKMEKEIEFDIIKCKWFRTIDSLNRWLEETDELASNRDIISISGSNEGEGLTIFYWG
jgi:hypothetical protein